MFDIYETDSNEQAIWRRMARGVCMRLRIQEGIPVTFLIGDGTAPSNESAVANWLEQRKSGICPEAFEDACIALEGELARVLDGQ